MPFQHHLSFIGLKLVLCASKLGKKALLSSSAVSYISMGLENPFHAFCAYSTGCTPSEEYYDDFVAGGSFKAFALAMTLAYVARVN